MLNKNEDQLRLEEQQRLAENFRVALKESGVAAKAVAEACEVTEQAVSGWKRTGKIRKEHLPIIARLTGWSVHRLLTGEEEAPAPAPAAEPRFESNIKPASIGTRRIPLLSYVQAGRMTEALEFGGEFEYLLTDLDLGPRAFALQIKGDSMLPEFRPGDRIIVDPDISPIPGDFVVAKNGHEEATFKKYRPRGADWRGETVFELVPLNEDYAPMRSDAVPISIIGTMVEHRKYRRR